MVMGIEKKKGSKKAKPKVKGGKRMQKNKIKINSTFDLSTGGNH